MNGKSLDITKDRLEKLKDVIPEVFAEDRIDFEKLKLALGEDLNIDNERYVLNWAGKSDAFKVLQTPSYATLAPVVEESVDFENTGNIFIEGENLEVLKILQKSYYGKIKMIYIDPPYNTGSDSFIYPDKFSESKDEYLKRIGDKDEEGLLTKEGLFRKNSKDSGRFHSNWLSMMYPRLFLARNLLRDDGVIFVSIDDNEVHNLRMIMNEIFGEENFVAEIPWKGKGGGADNKYLMDAHEYILFFAKSKTEFSVGEEKKENELFPKYDEIKKRYYKTQLARKWGSNSRRVDRPNLFYSIFTPDGNAYFPRLPNGDDGCWRWSKERMEKEINDGNVEFIKDGNDWIVYEKIFAPLSGEYNTKKYSTWFDKFGTTATGTNEVLSLFGEKIFDFPKPTLLLKTLLIIANVDSNDYVLDFFAGSGTLAHAVFELNFSDNLSRKFILVQIPEITETTNNNDSKVVSISNICQSRIKKVIEKIHSNSSNSELDLDDNNIDLGFKSFRLQNSNFKIWRSDFVENEFELSEQLNAFENHKKEKSSELDILYELLLKSGYELTVKVEKLEGFYSIFDNDLIIALSKFDKKICSDIIKLKPRKCITLDILFKGNDKLKTNTVLQFKDAGIEFKTI